MKTNFLKLILPFAVFMLAIVFAFASQSSTFLQEDVLINGFVYDDISERCIEVSKDCTLSGNFPCKTVENKEIHQLTGTMCVELLYEWTNK